MNKFDTPLVLRLKRAGKEFRANDSRIFYVKHEGWFVLTRGDTEAINGIASHDGIVGPFPSERNARTYIDMVLLATG